ncbi:MAG: hypothetical protein Q8P91_00445 [bacterium]|nr:hypothetical protein [bacterium]
MDPNQTNDNPVQDQTGVFTPMGGQTPQAPVITPEPQVPATEPMSEPIVPTEPVTPVTVPEPAPDAGNMDGDTTPPIPGV